MDSDLFLQRLSEQIEDCYPIGIEGTEVFSNYKNKPWEEKDYALPGFAHKYTTKKFVSRSQATFELLQVVKADQLDFDWKRAQIFDFAAGPGCAAAGVSRFLLQQNLEPHVFWIRCGSGSQRPGDCVRWASEQALSSVPI